MFIVANGFATTFVCLFFARNSLAPRELFSLIQSGVWRVFEGRPRGDFSGLAFCLSSANLFRIFPSFSASFFFTWKGQGAGLLLCTAFFFLPSLLGFLQMFYVSVCGQSRLGFT